MNELLMKKIKREEAFTLPEVLVTVLIFSILFGALIMILLSGTNSWQVNRVRTGLQQELRKAAEWLSEDLRQSGSGKITGVDPDGAWKTTIAFNKAVGASGNITAWSSDTYTYALGTTNTDHLERSDGTNTNVIARNIKTFQVRRFSTTPRIVEFNIVAEENTLHGTMINAEITFKVQTRNK